MTSRLTLSLALPMGLLLTACAPTAPSVAGDSSEAPSVHVSGGVAATSGEPHTTSGVSQASVAEGSTRAGGAITSGAHVALGTSRDTRPVVSSAGIRMMHDGGSGIAVQSGTTAAASRSRVAGAGVFGESRGDPRGPSSGAASTRGVVAAVAPGLAPAREPTPSLPLAVVAAAHPQDFTSEQLRVLVQLGENFLTDTTPTAPTAGITGGGNLDLTPAERWAMSAEASDERFRAMFGYQAFNAMQLQRAREAYAEAKK